MPKDVIAPISEAQIHRGFREVVDWLEDEAWFDPAHIPNVKDIIARTETLQADRNLNWIRAFSVALMQAWPKLNESTAVAIVLFIVLHENPESFQYSLPVAALNGSDIASLERTLRQVAPEFSDAIKDQTASPADILLRVIISTVLQVDPKSPAEAFLVDGSAHAIDSLFDTDAEIFLSKVLAIHDDIEDDHDEKIDTAIGYALIMCGADGIQEVWIQEPDDQGRYTIASMAKELANQTELSQEEVLAHPDLVAAAAKVICVHTNHEDALAHLFGVVSESLDAQGFVISVDPDLPTLHEVVVSGAFNAIKGGSPRQLRALIQQHPAVEDFRQTLSLFEEVKSTFNDRLTTIGEGLNDMRSSPDRDSSDYEQDGDED